MPLPHTRIHSAKSMMYRHGLTYMYSKTTNQGVTQDIINANYALRLNYMYDRRYAVEADMALMGSNRFKSGDKYFFSAAGGLAWISKQ